MKIVVDWDIAREVFATLLEASSLAYYPFDRALVPHRASNLPAGLSGPKEHAMFLFTSDYYMQGGIKSETAFRQLSSMHNKRPEMFVADEARYMMPRQIERELREARLGMRTSRSKWWVSNAEAMQREFDGDPRNIFVDLPESADERWEVLMKRIAYGYEKKQSGFKGHQKKMVSMLTYFLMDSLLISLFTFPLPIDFHLLRILTCTGIIRVIDISDSNLFTERVLDTARDVTFEYCRQNNISPLRLCDALWLYSGAMCSQAPGNQSTVEKVRNGRKTKIWPVNVDWSNGQLKAYRRSCGICLVADHCDYCMRSAPYYIQGKAFLEQRQECPTEPRPLFPGIPNEIHEHPDKHRRLWLPDQIEMDLSEAS